jgi:hypothetical protein
MKYYLHRENIFGIFASFAFLAMSVYMLRVDGYSFTSVSIILVFFVLTCCYIGRAWVYRKDKKIVINFFDKVVIEIRDNELRFPRGYYFKHASIAKYKVVPAAIINELNIASFPPTIVINNNEVIFLKSELQEKLIVFADRNKIPIVKRTDVWELINEPFLDTEFTKEEGQKTFELLKVYGVSHEEALSIRKKIKATMFLGNYYLWEWQTLGHIDYLRFTHLNARKYWWSMGIALWNYKTEGQQYEGN